MNAERSKHLVVHFVGSIPLPDVALKGALRFAETDRPRVVPVPVENSNSGILVVQPAQNQNGNDVTVRLHRARVRRILAQG